MNKCGSLGDKKIIIQLALIILLYSVLRVPLLDKAFWYDEMFSTSLSVKDPFLLGSGKTEGLSWSIRKPSPQDELAIHPPLVIFFFYAWDALFGDSEISLHTATALAGLAGVILLYFLGVLVFGSDVGFMAALAAAAAPSVLSYSTQAIYVIFEMLFFIASLLFFCRFIITENKIDFKLLIFLNLCGILVFYHYFFFLCVQTAVLWFCRERLKIRPAYFIAVSLLVCVFLAFILLNKAKGRYAYDYWPKSTFKEALFNIKYIQNSFIPWF